MRWIQIVRCPKIILISLIISFNGELNAQENLASQYEISTEENRLEVEELNFSINLPTNPELWIRQQMDNVGGKKSTGFVYEHPSGHEVCIIVILNKSFQILTPADSNDFISGFIQSFPKDWKITFRNISAIDIPLPNSLQVAFTITITDTLMQQQNLYGYGYITPGKRTYLLLNAGIADTEPESFSQMVRSFRLLDPKANEYKVGLLAGNFLLIFKFFGLILILTIIIELVFTLHRSKSKKSPNSASVSAVSNPISTDAIPTDIQNKTLSEWSCYLIIIGITMSFLSAKFQNYDEDWSLILGWCLGALLLPFLISYFVRGRKKIRDWNKFARLFFWLCILFSYLSITGIKK